MTCARLKRSCPRLFSAASLWSGSKTSSLGPQRRVQLRNGRQVLGVFEKGAFRPYIVPAIQAQISCACRSCLCSRCKSWGLEAPTPIPCMILHAPQPLDPHLLQDASLGFHPELITQAFRGPFLHLAAAASCEELIRSRAPLRCPALPRWRCS